MPSVTQSVFSESTSPTLSETGLDEGFVRISKLAVGSFVLALFTPLALVTISLLPLSGLVILLGALAVWRILRDPSLGGRIFAQVAIGLGLLTATWGTIAAQRQTQYLFQTAGHHARDFLQILAAGDKYTAMELHKSESDRQITGTNLKLTYGGSESEDAQAMRHFLAEPSTKAVLASGQKSKWQFVRGVRIEGSNSSGEVTVEMQNVAGDEPQSVFVKLRRQTEMLAKEGDHPTAFWHVSAMWLPQ